MTLTTPAGFTIGFDLDMTLIDSRPGIKAVWDALSAETGVHVDSELAITRLGPPLEQELAHWAPAEQIPALVDTYRALYPTYGIEPTKALPGAREAIAAIHERGGRAVVVTAKNEHDGKLHLDRLDLGADRLIGGLWAEAKGLALKEEGADAYVGDHLGDIKGARTAGALAVAVATGPIPAADLRAAGADTVLADLAEFPAWLDGFLAARAA